MEFLLVISPRGDNKLVVFFFFLFHVQSYSFFFSTNTFSRWLGCYEIMFSLKKGN